MNFSYSFRVRKMCILCNSRAHRRLSGLDPSVDLDVEYLIDSYRCRDVTHLPPIHWSVTKLKITDCISLKSIPPLPQNLEKLYISNSGITELPPLIHTSLRVLILRDLPLKSIPPLPDTIEFVECINLKFLTQMEKIPSTIRNCVLCMDCPVLTDCDILENKVNIQRGCPWIQAPDYWNRYGENIVKLKKIQRWFRKELWKRRMEKRIRLSFFPREVVGLINSF